MRFIVKLGFVLSLEEIVRVVLNAPTDLGVRLTEKISVCPADMLEGSEVWLRVKDEEFVPVLLITGLLESIKSDPPELEIVKLISVPVDPKLREPMSNEPPLARVLPFTETEIVGEETILVRGTNNFIEFDGLGREQNEIRSRKKNKRIFRKGLKICFINLYFSFFILIFLFVRYFSFFLKKSELN